MGAKAWAPLRSLCLSQILWRGVFFSLGETGGLGDRVEWGDCGGTSGDFKGVEFGVASTIIGDGESFLIVEGLGRGFLKLPVVLKRSHPLVRA